jgi:hypothetical protein
LQGRCEGAARALRGRCEGAARALQGRCGGAARALRGRCEGAGLSFNFFLKFLKFKNQNNLSYLLKMYYFKITKLIDGTMTQQSYSVHLNPTFSFLF